MKFLSRKILNYFKYRSLVKKGLFDKQFYYESNPDVKKTKMNPFAHFVKFGWKEGRNPNHYFDVNYYLAQNPDVKQSGEEPYSHYLNQGWQEGRNPNPFFDVKYYLESNQNVLLAGQEPLEHYISQGWQKGCNPSPLFDIHYYLSSNLDVKLAGIEPLLHYIHYGLKEGRANCESITLLSHPNYNLQNRIAVPQLIGLVDIVIPIYNGYEFMEPLFSSLYNGTTTPHRIIVINDCSPDPKIELFLEKVDSYKNRYCLDMIVKKNKSNLGFVATVNSALADIENNFVILNSDVEVPISWLERLIHPLESDPQIASTTPFTNSGTICSFPVWLQDNDLPFGLDVNQLDANFCSIDLAKTQQEIPTGVGFCMGLRKSLVDEIGLFDVLTFERGYGEENDWCMRALNHGYKNVHVTNLFIYHKHGGSFGAEKQVLCERNYQRLLIKHPKYEAKVAKYIKNDPLSELRCFIMLKVAFSIPETVLIFDHLIGGGTDKFTHENLIAKNISVVRISETNDKKMIVQIYYNNQLLQKFLLKSLEYLIINFLVRLKIKVIYVNHLLFFSNIEMCRQLLLNHAEESRYYFHDYFAICPSYTLLNEKGVYCGAELDVTTCNACIKNNNYVQLKTEFNLKFEKNIAKHRSEFRELLQACSKIICFSKNGCEIVSKIYPEVATQIFIEPHTAHTAINNLPMKVDKIDFRRKKQLTIGVLGAINYCKGRQILEELANKSLFRKGSLKLVLLGYADKNKINNCTITGKYSASELAGLVLTHPIDMFIIPSIWPETFCFTADEIMLANYPLITFDIGAHAERVKNYSHGFLVSSITSEKLYDKIIEVTRHYGADL